MTQAAAAGAGPAIGVAAHGVAAAPTLPHAVKRAAALRAAARRRDGLRRLRPAAAFLYALVLALASLALSNPLEAAGVFLLIVAALGVSRRLTDAWPYARLALLIGVIVIVVNPLFTTGGLDVLWSHDIGPLEIRVSIQSLAYGVSSALRLMGVILAFALVNLIVDADDQLAIMSRVSFRSGIVLSLASRLLPVFSRDATRITDAQRSRGVQLDRGRGGDRAAPRVPLLACMLTQSLERAVDVAASMESRGYGAGRRTHWARRRPWRCADIAAGSASLVVIAALLSGFASGACSYTFFPLLEDPWPQMSGTCWLVVFTGLCIPLVVTRPWRRSRPSNG